MPNSSSRPAERGFLASNPRRAALTQSSGSCSPHPSRRPIQSRPRPSAHAANCRKRGRCAVRSVRAAARAKATRTRIYSSAATRTQTFGCVLVCGTPEAGVPGSVRRVAPCLGVRFGGSQANPLGRRFCCRAGGAVPVGQGPGWWLAKREPESRHSSGSSRSHRSGRHAESRLVSLIVLLCPRLLAKRGKLTLTRAVCASGVSW